ncbi:hypothetical protein [Shimia sediminis]|uniref:hypothetical protein n=1 Tax=Shimia sediminis TaxID=2497945 RepID=UPI000F8EFB4F|nr:hypothetical protein [Shimia sediminis]
MSEISDLESRISAAMDRISRGLETLPATPVAMDTGDAEALEAAQAELENEKLANTQLQERVKTLNAKVEEVETALADATDAVEKAAEAREAAVTELRDAQAAHEAAMAEAKDQTPAEPTAAVIDLDSQRDTIAQLANRLKRLRQTSRQVRGANQQLRDAAQKNLSDPALINQSLAAELENLKAMRAAELAEMEVIMAALRPMLGDTTTPTPDDKEQS